jgi:hypothetical protein
MADLRSAVIDMVGVTWCECEDRQSAQALRSQWRVRHRQIAISADGT